MRKSALLAAALGFAMPTYSHAQEIVLRFWDNQQTESGLSQYQQEAVKSFEAANPDIKIEVTTVPYPEYQQRLLTAVQGGNAPDVSTIDQIWVAAFAAAAGWALAHPLPLIIAAVIAGIDVIETSFLLLVVGRGR